MSDSQLRLGVNIDHVATLRQTRQGKYPDPVYAALIAEENGADFITLHLREDKRHIQEYDVLRLLEQSQTWVNLEMAATDNMVNFAIAEKPATVCLVPEKREELTTEGGLDVAGNLSRVTEVVGLLQHENIEVSLFIDADKDQIDASLSAGVGIIEIHTGSYADAQNKQIMHRELEFIVGAVDYAVSNGLQVNAGHGLNYHNVLAIAEISAIQELNIGHAIVSRALFSGFATAVADMKQLMMQARR